jgi:hypothetical protein
VSESRFELFKQRFGSATSAVNVPAESLEKYSGRLPDRLLSIWRQEGWGAYGKGLFWLVNPDEYDGVLEDWLSESPLAAASFRVIARTAFGALFAWSERFHQSITIDCPGNFILVFEDSVFTREPHPDAAIEAFFLSLWPDNLDLEGDDGNELFDRALARLGPLSKDELYGFEPALVLGGPCVVENLAKLRIDVHLSILRQFGEPAVPPLTAPA